MGFLEKRRTQRYLKDQQRAEAIARWADDVSVDVSKPDELERAGYRLVMEFDAPTVDLLHRAKGILDGEASRMGRSSRGSYVIGEAIKMRSGN